MKLEIQKPEFEPIRIVIETEEELRELAQALDDYIDDQSDDVEAETGRFSKVSFTGAYENICIIKNKLGEYLLYLRKMEKEG